MIKFQTACAMMLSYLQLSCQVPAIRNAIRPLFVDPVKYTVVVKRLVDAQKYTVLCS